MGLLTQGHTAQLAELLSYAASHSVPITVNDDNNLKHLLRVYYAPAVHQDPHTSLVGSS